jgi:hypothetical protein|tara:strand:- start:367 stop:555 length:189 start_codon:yes stop_codon:yes gene_type:complete
MTITSLEDPGVGPGVGPGEGPRDGSSLVYMYPSDESAEHPTQAKNIYGAYWVAIVYYTVIKK